MNIFNAIRGLYKIEIKTGDARRIISALVFERIPFGEITSDNDGISFLCRRGDIDRIAKIGEAAGLSISSHPTGLAALIQRYKRRIGIPIGAMIALIMVILSSEFIFDIEISGNERVDSKVIEEELSSLGFRLGAYIPSLDCGEICKRIASENDEISWISINMRGTVAHVEIRERNDAKVIDTSSPSNIVAAYDGQIVSVEAYGGQSKVRAGQTVKKGELLISGIIDSPALGYRTVRARGRVFARVTKVFSAEEELLRSIKIYTGRKTVKKTIKIFSKSINLFKNSNISYEKYDTIENEERLSLFGARLPISVITRSYEEYNESSVLISSEEAEKVAATRISKMIGEEAALCDVLYRHTDTYTDTEKCRVTVYLECICDISTEQKIGGDSEK